MKNKFFKNSALVALTILSLASCKKTKTPDDVIAPYDIPTTYNFSDANYTSSTNRAKMWLELDAYMKLPNAGTALDATKATNLFNNTGNAFTEAALNTSGVSIVEKTTDAPVFKKYLDDLVTESAITTIATNGKAGYAERSATTKVIVNATGLENGQAVAKGLMGSLLFKQAMDLLTLVKTDGTIADQKKHFDEAFGYLSVPVNYDPTVTYASTLVFPAKPIGWGGYLAERGKDINAGKVIFDAFLKGRAAIGAKDIKVRDEQITIIKEKWEQLAAAAALAYFTNPTTGDAGVGTFPGVKLHALSEAYGFVEALKYRPANSKLSAANYTRLQTIIKTNFYTLLNEAGYTMLKEGQTILKTAYGL
ncbi:DUF4856 domain-containing protein [Pedobacter sp. Hv1]|uniref:DUF4856 domain-containing protein n=1 Tax=Pedobacter sp. Hv1 TaxID=1740090 RepID=UPI000A9F1C46|nr:DUF4856 domain-containing protein [Pedobacter sp. Hv1]